VVGVNTVAVRGVALRTRVALRSGDATPNFTMEGDIEDYEVLPAF
jgi:hypothetical protein